MSIFHFPKYFRLFWIFLFFLFFLKNKNKGEHNLFVVFAFVSISFFPDFPGFPQISLFFRVNDLPKRVNDLPKRVNDLPKKPMPTIHGNSLFSPFFCGFWAFWAFLGLFGPTFLFSFFSFSFLFFFSLFLFSFSLFLSLNYLKKLDWRWNIGIYRIIGGCCIVLLLFVPAAMNLDIAKNPCLGQWVIQWAVNGSSMLRQSTEKRLNCINLHCCNTLYAYIMYWRNRCITQCITKCITQCSALFIESVKIAANPQLHNWTIRYTTTIR